MNNKNLINDEELITIIEKYFFEGNIAEISGAFLDTIDDKFRPRQTIYSVINKFVIQREKIKEIIEEKGEKSALQLKRYYRIPYSKEMIEYILENIDREPFIKEENINLKSESTDALDIKVKVPSLESGLSDNGKELLKQYREGRGKEGILNVLNKRLKYFTEEDKRVLTMLIGDGQKSGEDKTK